jgi:hypothetical protein
MNKKQFDLLEEGLQRLDSGESLESILASHPEEADLLRPLLTTSARLRPGSTSPLPVAVLSRQRTRGLALAAELRGGRRRNPRTARFWRQIVTATAVIALLAMSGQGLLIASAHSIPGDTLYPLKRSVESTQLQFVSDPTQKRSLEQEFSDRRIEETKSLLTIQRIEPVSFDGAVTSQNDMQWIVSGIPVFLTPTTQIDPGIRIGDEVEVYGMTNAAGGVDASRITLHNDSEGEDNLPGGISTQTPSANGSQEFESEATFPYPTPTTASPVPTGTNDREWSGSSTPTPGEHETESQATQSETEGDEDH